MRSALLIALLLCLILLTIISISDDLLEARQATPTDVVAKNPASRVKMLAEYNLQTRVLKLQSNRNIYRRRLRFCSTLPLSCLRRDPSGGGLHHPA